MRVRAFEAGDRDELGRLYRAMFPDSDDADVPRLIARLPDASAVFVIDREPPDNAASDSRSSDGASANGSRPRLGGFVEAGWRGYAEGCESSPVPYVEAWYVDADLRRRRWGRALVAAVEDWARAHGAVELASDAQLENGVSLEAHQKLGFREVERITCFRKPL